MLNLLITEFSRLTQSHRNLVFLCIDTQNSHGNSLAQFQVVFGFLNKSFRNFTFRQVCSQFAKESDQSTTRNKSVDNSGGFETDNNVFDIADNGIIFHVD